VPNKAFLKIANAKKAAAKLGSANFMREFASRMKP
jgi:hypothetical protein